MDPPSGALSRSSSRDPPDPSSPTTSPPPPPPDAVVQTAAVLRSEEYRQLFRLPAEEVLVEDFNCAYQENILVQGHMYLFAHHICFYSNIFGFETKVKFVFYISGAGYELTEGSDLLTSADEITSVKRAKTAGIFPNAIEINAGGKKYFFASFLSRDEAFNLITDGWVNHGGSFDETTEKQVLTPQSSQRENGFESGSIRNSTYDDETGSGRNMDAPECIDSGTVPDFGDNKLSTMTPKREENVEGHDDGLSSTSPSPSNLKPRSWKVEDVDACKIPEDAIKVAESKFLITVEEFFNLFFSDDAFKFVESFHKRCGDKDLKCTPWKQDDRFGHSRSVSFLHPIKIYLGARCGTCQELQKFRVFKNSNLVIQTSQKISDVPYGDYFHVEGLWDVRRDGDESCSLSVYTRVAFVKKTMFKGKIVQSTVEECREAYASWIELAHNLLKERNLERREDDITTNCGTTLNGNAGAHNAGNIGSSDTLEPVNDPSVPENYGSTTLIPSDGWPSLQSFVGRETLTLLQQSMVKLWPKLRRKIHLPLLVVLLFTIILLVQLSIVVLLSRQKENIQDLPRGDNVGKVEDRSTEAMAWLEKRLYYLKEEVSLVEARFERMQWEYSRMKQQLRELEEFHNK